MTGKYKLEISEPHIEDVETGECYDLCGKDNLEYIVELWNKIVDENERLKSENQNLRKCINEIYLISSKESVE